MPVEPPQRPQPRFIRTTPPPARRAAFIDKDGTLVEDVPYNVDPALLRFTRHAVDGLRLLAEAGYLIVVVTNQPGVALGLFDTAALDRLADALAARLAAEGVVLTGFYACPHAPAAEPAEACGCRKPAPGLLRDAARELGISLADSWMIGDILNDVEAGQRAGCRTVLLDVGNETEWQISPWRTPMHRVADLRAAALAILASDRESALAHDADCEAAAPLSEGR